MQVLIILTDVFTELIMDISSDNNTFVVYSGKALYRFMIEVQENQETYRNSRIVFW